MTSVSDIKDPEQCSCRTDAQIPALSRAIPGSGVGFDPHHIPYPYFPLLLLDHQPDFHLLLIKCRGELCCNRHSTLIRTRVWPIAQNICGWLWCQRCDVIQIRWDGKIGIFQISILKEETSGISAEGHWGRTPGTAAPVLLPVFMSVQNPRVAGTMFLPFILKIIQSCK